MSGPFYENKKANVVAGLELVRKERQRLGHAREAIQRALEALATEAQAIFGLPQPDSAHVQAAHQYWASTEDLDPVTGRPFASISEEFEPREDKPHAVTLSVGDRELSFAVNRDGQLYAFANDTIGRTRIAIVPRNAARSLESLLRIMFVETANGPTTTLVLEGSTAGAITSVPLIDLIAQILDEAAQRAESLAQRIEIRTFGQSPR